MTTEGLGNRVKRLLTANVHALVSSLEARTPQAVLEQYLREFDEVIAQARVGLGQHEAAKHQAAKAIARLNNEIERLDEQVTVALNQGDDAAARAGTERQIDLEDQLGTLNGSLQEAVEKSEATETDLLGLRAKRAEMEQALAGMVAARSATERGGSVGAAPGASAGVRAEQLEQGFNRAMTSATGVAGLGAGNSSADASLLKRLETLHKEQRVNERLERLKAGRGAARS
ncbi:PspA/IM30 family protein [Cupriavidus basilensis OR16]|uniref:PspA/IM30 family protein n=1 Tax=Cupriavidus basilensis OR16 TaxID=1127483 RepID=H1S6B2_9BURK|nr:PspA/IM30 family protein [Cupriavidus basilensis]EHP41936.1 PspA/IM30 family protein [Cupriavidus basilensis OR16]